MSVENLPIVGARDDRSTMAMAQATDRPQGNPIAEPDETGFPYRALHQLLRGRYLTAIGLGITLALALAAGGWVMTKPLYRSESLIRISYDIPRINRVDEYRPLDVFEAFMQSQVAMLSSHRIIAEAMKDPLWQEHQIDLSTTTADGFAQGLVIEHKQGTEHLKVTFQSPDAVFAAMAVRSVVNTYTRLYSNLDQQSAKEKTAALDAQRDQLLARLDELEAVVRKESVEFGSSNIDRFYDAAVQNLTRVEAALIDVRIALALTQGVKKAEGRTARYSPQQIARVDPTMARYMAEREATETQLAQLRLRGYGEGHNQIVQVKRQLEMIVNRIRDYAMDYQSIQPAAATMAPGALGGAQVGLIGRSVEELRADEANLTALSQKEKTQLLALGAKKLNIETIRSEMAKTKEQLTGVSERLTMLQLDSGLSGRMSVMSTGEIPLRPYRDRRPHIAAAGALGGFVLPAAAIVAAGASRRRYRYSDDAAEDWDHSIPLLGILPQLPARLTDPESAADAAQCVHQIRVMLQVHSQSRRSSTHLVTSACPGEGKTSLTAALALSYAAAGANTLLVDADLIGQRLTRGYRMEDQPGFREVISGRHGVSIYPTAVTNLSILPAGISDGRDACAVSSGVIKRLMVELRKRFDVVLIDSGPILGSLEALVVAGQVDGVVLTISREQQKPLVDRAIRQLKSVGARIAGMVFNKAQSWDFKRSVGVSSLRSIPRSAETGLARAGVTSTSGFGSLVDSVQTYLPDSRN